MENLNKALLDMYLICYICYYRLVTSTHTENYTNIYLYCNNISISYKEAQEALNKVVIGLSFKLK